MEKKEIDFGKRLAMGGLRLPVYDNANTDEVDKETLKECVDIFQENGYNYYDTSWFYHGGNSERALGECLVDRYPRDEFLFSNKMPIKFMTKAEQMEPIFEEQLKKCHLDYFDFYLIHQLAENSYKQWTEWGIWEFLMQKREEGKFREFGLSIHESPEFLDKVLTEHPEVDFVMLQINYVDWVSPALRARELYEVATKHDTPIIVMEPCKGGTLANPPEEAAKLMKEYNPDASFASWAYRWVASLPNVRVVSVGMPRKEFLLDNIETFNNFVPLNEEEYAIIDEVVDIINANTAIACTNCKYCEEACPRNIAIGDYFGLYNDWKRQTESTDLNEVNTQCIQYICLTDHAGKASDCIKCGKCEKVCPQHLNIVDYLENCVYPELELADPANRMNEGAAKNME